MRGQETYPKIEFDPRWEVLEGAIPFRFITLTYERSRARFWDEIDRDVGRFLIGYCRAANVHLSAVVGIVEGLNAHVHIILYKKPFEQLRKSSELFGHADLWRAGRASDDAYDDRQDGLRYVLAKHKWLPQAGKIFCPNKRHSCRRGRCEQTR